jgi:hypothetical protein
MKISLGSFFLCLKRVSYDDAYDAYEGNDNVKHPRTPMCGARRGEWDCVIDVAHRGQGYSNTLEIWLK